MSLGHRVTQRGDAATRSWGWSGPYLAWNFQVWEGGGEYNVARGLRRCFGMDATIVTALADNAVGRLVQDLIYQEGVDQSHLKMGQVRRGWSHSTKRFELYGTRIWCACSCWLFRQRPHSVATETRAISIGTMCSIKKAQAGFTPVEFSVRSLRRRRRLREKQWKPRKARHDRFIRLELPRLIVAPDWRTRKGRCCEPRIGATCRCHDWKRRRLSSCPRFHGRKGWMNTTQT